MLRFSKKQGCNLRLKFYGDSAKIIQRRNWGRLSHVTACINDPIRLRSKKFGWEVVEWVGVRSDDCR